MKGSLLPRYKRRRPSWRFSLRTSVMLILLCLAVFPPLFFHFRLSYLRRVQIQKCGWIKNPPMVCAHGGDSSKAPPNTLEAYRLALDLQVDCIEIDASRTRDGILVALHDRELQNIYAHRTVAVGDLDWNEIRNLNLAESNMNVQIHNVPTIELALKYVSRSLKQVIIDAKDGPPLFDTSLAADILQVVNSTKCDNCLVWAKNDNVVLDLKSLSPGTKELGIVTWEHVPVPWIPGTFPCDRAGYIVLKDPTTGKTNKLLRMGAVEVVGAYYGLVNAGVVSQVRRAGKRLYVWTVNDVESMERMVREGVDCIVTSHPSVLQRTMVQMQTQCREEGYLP